MTEQDQLAMIKARWFGDELHRAEWWADHASRDVPRLVGEIERLRKLVEYHHASNQGRIGDYCGVCQERGGIDSGNANEPAPSPER